MANFVHGLAGVHGTGKTTIINALKEMGILVEAESISRKVQAILGWTSLKEAGESEANMWKLQDAIFGYMVERDKMVNERGIPTVVDRTFTDVWAYTSLWISRMQAKEIGFDQFRANEYRVKCQGATSRYKTTIMVPLRPEIPFVAEPGREEEGSRELTEVFMHMFNEKLKIPVLKLTALSVEDRVEQVLSAMRLDGEQGVDFYRYHYGVHQL